MAGDTVVLVEDNPASVSVDHVPPAEQRRRASELHIEELKAETYTLREKTRLVLVGPKVQLLIAVCAITDLILLIYQLAASMDEPSTGIYVTTWIILGIYAIELFVRMYALRPWLFFTNIEAIFDFVVVVGSIILMSLEQSKAGHVLAISRGAKAVFRILQVMRGVRAVSIAKRQSSLGLSQAARNITGENKKRFVDLANNIDIDLTYINKQIIAMGVPTTGLVAMYRNPLWQVVRFFKRHEGKYRIYNVCPELPYDHAKFGNNVVAYDVQDHTPPNMDILIEFLADASKFVSEGADRVIAVHCRGGKGRTGSMVCSWLIYSQYCTDSEDALSYFAQARTELRKSSSKLQGVDTPSQKRYVRSVAKWLAQNNSYLKSGVPVTKPKAMKISLQSVTVSGYFRDPASVEGPLIAAVHLNGAGGGKIVKISPPIDGAAITGNQLVFDLGGYVCEGDIRITIFKQKKLQKGVNEGLVLADAEGLKGPQELTKRKIAGKEPGVLFYFLFHSTFVEEDGLLKVPVDMMDKAFKNKKNKYLMDGMTTLKVSFPGASVC